jgi:group II intron reverse transcriptase/maturase
VYKRKNLEMAWERVPANRGSGGVDGQSLEEFERQADAQLNRLHTERREDWYQPRPVRQVQIPKAGKPGEVRTLGIPTIYDRVCQQALLNRLEPIFEPVFDEANFGYRRGRSTKDALRKGWKEIQEEGREWIVDADLKDFFGSGDHKKLLTLVTQRVAEGRVRRRLQARRKAGSYSKGRLFPSERGTPQGGVLSPLLSHRLLTPLDQEMCRRGYRLTRYADDWVVTCKSAEEARAAVAAALRILSELGVQVHPQKTRIVRVRQGFEFLGYKIKRGKQLQLPPGKIRSGAQPGALYAYPREKSIRRFRDQVRQLTKRRVPLTTKELIEELNPVLRGWGHYYKRAHVRRLFNRLDGWIVRRIWSQHFRRWRNDGWRRLPESTLYGEHGLENLVRLIPSLVSQRSASS